MAARLTPRRAGEFLALWLCAWLSAREALTVLFAFHPLKLLVWSGLFVLLFRLWLSSRKSRLIGAGALLAAAAATAFWPASDGGQAPVQKIIAFGFDFIGWLRTVASSAELPLHPRFGTALWLLFVIGTALLTVLLLDTLRMPVAAGVLFCVLFTVLQLAPFVQDRQTSRLLLTLVMILGCCTWFYAGKKWDASRKTRGYARWQLGMAGLLLPALLLAAATAGVSEMSWRSSSFSGGLDRLADHAAELFSRGIGTGGSRENLDLVELGGDRVETGAARFTFNLKSELNLQSRVYLRSAVFDRYTGYHWQRTLDTEENAVDYAPGSQEFLSVLHGYIGEQDSGFAPYTIRDVVYDTSRIPTPLGTFRLASTRLSDIAVLQEKSGVPRFVIRLQDNEEEMRPYACWSEKQVSYAGTIGLTNCEPLPAVPMTASAYGEVTSAEPLRDQYIIGWQAEGKGGYFDDGEQKPWSAGLETALTGITFAEMTGTQQNPEVSEYLAPYLTLPDTLPAEVWALADTLKRSHPYWTAVAIRDYLKSSYSYTLTPKDTDREFVSSFLFDVKEGYCTSFATAMTVLARACEIPARYVEGYAVDHTSAVVGTLVTDVERHAWTELYFPSVGWLTFDATSFSAASAMPLAREELDLSPYEETPEEPDVPEPEKPEPEEPEPETPEAPDEPTSGGTSRIVLPIWAMVILALAGTAAALYLLFRLRMTAWERAQKRYRGDSRYVRAAFYELTRCAGALGCTHTPTQTVGDYFEALAPMGLSENARLQCARAARAVDTAIYGGREPEEIDLHALADILAGAYRRLLYLRGKVWLMLWWRKGENI